MPSVDDDYPEYSVGDLVKLYSNQRFYWEWHDYDELEETIGIVLGRTDSWYEAYKESKKDNDKGGTRYWDNVNYAPYKVMTIEGNVEWVSPQHMQLIS